MNGEAVPDVPAPEGEEPVLLPGESRTSRRHRLVSELGVFLGTCLVVGALAGLLWSQLAVLPGYLVDDQGRATTSERGLAEQFSGDAWFCLLAAVGGLLIGVLAWWRLVRVGWTVILLAAAGALVAGGLAWLVGWTMGPGDFETRLAQARPGDLVPIQLTLRAPVSLLVWPFMASIPILLWSSLAPDNEEPTPLFGRRRGPGRRRRHEAVAGVLPEDLPGAGPVHPGGAVDQPTSAGSPGRP